MTRGITLDAGALIAFERGDRTVIALIAQALAHRLSIAIPAGVVGQVWRNGQTQVRLARFLGSSDVQVVSLDDREARAAGQLCGVRGTSDVIDATVVLCARPRHHRVVTSDPDDIRRLDSTVEIIPV